MRSDLKNLDSFTFETSKNHLIRNLLHNGRVRVNSIAENSELIAQQDQIDNVASENLFIEHCNNEDCSD